MQPKKKRGAAAVAVHRRKKPVRTFSRYIYAVLKLVHPDQGISKKAMAVLNSFASDMFERIAAEAGRLARYNKRQTMTAREMQTAVRLLMPHDLAKHACQEGLRAVTKYNVVQSQLLTPKQRANAEMAGI